jgi:formamidopyrimidine-DNA glycosylase
MAVLADDELGSVLGGLGPDALTDLPRSAALELALARRSAPIKALLLDQRIVAGLGNIYADEALHRARIDPRRPGGTLTAAEIGRLRTAIRITLAAGLRWGGTSLDDLAYLLPDGTAGEYTARLRAYGREDQPCRVCGTPIRRVMLRQRSTHWCPRCQT